MGIITFTYTTESIIQTSPPKILYKGKARDENNKSVINQIKQTKDFDDLWFLVDSFTTTMDIPEPLKECIIISDFQTRENVIDFLPKEWKYYFIDAGPVNNNISINNLNVVSRIKVPDQLIKIKTTINNSSLKICQWFLDPLSKFGPDHVNNSKRILNKTELIDNTFLTTDPSPLSLKIPNSSFIPNPCDASFEVLKNYEHKCNFDVFFAMTFLNL